MNSYVANFSIGEILVKAGVVSQNQVDEAVKESGTRQRLIGKTLVERGWLTQNQLRAGLEAQASLRDGAVDSYSAIKALAIACNFERTFAEALSEVLPNRALGNGANSCRLGELLVAAGIVDSATFEIANAKSLESHEPLGKVLIAEGLITQAYLDAALELQVCVRDGLYSKDQAVEALKQNPEQFLEFLAPEIESSSNIAALNNESVRIGELFMRAGIVSDADVQHALEFSRTHHHPIGEMLLARGFITRALLDAALSLQKMVAAGQLTLENATACLQLVFSTDMPVSQCLLQLNLLAGAPKGARYFAKEDKSRKAAVRNRQTGVKWTSINFDFLRSKEDLQLEAARQMEEQKVAVAELDKLLETVVAAQSDEVREAARASEGSVRYIYDSADRMQLYENQRSIYSRLARVLLKHREYLLAEELFNEAIDISAQQELDGRQAVDQMFLAGLYLQQGKTWQSERLIKLCLTTFEAVPKLSERVLGLCHHRLGLVYCRMGLFSQAEKQFIHACELMLASEDKSSDNLTKRRLAAIYKDYAVLLRSVKREMEAAKYYAHARAIQRFDH